jgi:hypothetical protein
MMDFDGCCSLSKMRIEAMKTRLVATNQTSILRIPAGYVDKVVGCKTR